MFNEMRFASLLGKVQARDFRAATAREVVNAATVNGAKAVGRSDIGRLAVGAKADLLVVDLGNYSFGPIPIR
jgi:cytosine/adenosine deaminase-related metal-dependent hydrolase